MLQTLLFSHGASLIVLVVYLGLCVAFVVNSPQDKEYTERNPLKRHPHRSVESNHDDYLCPLHSRFNHESSKDQHQAPATQKLTCVLTVRADGAATM